MVIRSDTDSSGTGTSESVSSITITSPGRTLLFDPEEIDEEVVAVEEALRVGVGTLEQGDRLLTWSALDLELEWEGAIEETKNKEPTHTWTTVLAADIDNYTIVSHSKLSNRIIIKDQYIKSLVYNLLGQ